MKNKNLETEICCRLDEIKTAIENACRRSKRSSSEISILPISKKQPLEIIEAAYNCGIRTFGESYVQEASQKIESLADFADIEWEMVGHIQSNKAKAAAQLFSKVHSLDSLKLARLLNKHRPENLPPLDVFIEVNLAGEASKTGFPAQKQADWESLIPIIEQISNFDKLNLKGLMTMPPLFENVEDVRPYFVRLRELRDYLNSQVTDLQLTELSAGTSSDFEIAIEEGATVIRIGERLLGPRIY